MNTWALSDKAESCDFQLRILKKRTGLGSHPSSPKPSFCRPSWSMSGVLNLEFDTRRLAGWVSEVRGLLVRRSLLRFGGQSILSFLTEELGCESVRQGSGSTLESSAQVFFALLFVFHFLLRRTRSNSTTKSANSLTRNFIPKFAGAASGRSAEAALWRFLACRTNPISSI